MAFGLREFFSKLLIWKHKGRFELPAPILLPHTRCHRRLAEEN